MADEPVEDLNGQTPLEAAKTPRMDALAKQGKVGLLRTIPAGFVPASDVGNLSIMGYDPKVHYAGRGPLEAANMGVALSEGDVAFRCNLVTVDGDRLVDYSSGHIATEQSVELIEQLNKELGSKTLKFYPGVKYRHLAVFTGSDSADALVQTVCEAPHDAADWKISEHLPKGAAADLLSGLMEKSRSILMEHTVNKVRIDLKENPGNMIWFWGQGKPMHLPTYKEQWNITGSVISAVDLVRGAGRLAGLKVIDVEGATGYYDTNYQGKADAALQALEKEDFVFVHLEAADEAGHNGHLREKIAAIENFDRVIVGTLMDKLPKSGVRYLVTADHPTSVTRRAHTAEPVPFVIAGEGIEPDGVQTLSESSAASTEWLIEEAHTLLPQLLTEKKL